MTTPGQLSTAAYSVHSHIHSYPPSRGDMRFMHTTQHSSGNRVTALSASHHFPWNTICNPSGPGRKQSVPTGYYGNEETGL